MIIGVQLFDEGAIPKLTFESATVKARTALWSKGRSIILIVDGREHEFYFTATFTETTALALLKECGVPILREDAPTFAVLLTQGICMLALALKFFFG